MTPNTMTLARYSVFAERAPREVAVAVEPATRAPAEVMSPFSRRPVGKPLSRGERVGVLAICAVLGIVMTTVLVRGDRAFQQGSTPAAAGAR